MRVLFTSAHAYLPEAYGGMQSSTHALASFAAAQGHSVSLLCSLVGSGLFGLLSRIKLKLSPANVATDWRYGYSIHRTWRPVDAVPNLVRRWQPDIAVVETQGAVPMAQALERMAVPVVIYVRNVEFKDLEGDPRILEETTIIANSKFTAQKLFEEFGIQAAVIPPTIDCASYATDGPRNRVTFINPVEKKGYDIAIALARECPHIPFSFIESWALSPDEKARVLLDVEQLPNVQFLGRVDDMRRVFAHTRILIVPSMWEEAWGRVASEAQCSGIPVIASNRGGLSEAVGDGGILVDPYDSISEWKTRLLSVWSDSGVAEDLSRRARAHSQRREFTMEAQGSAFLQVLESRLRCD